MGMARYETVQVAQAVKSISDMGVAYLQIVNETGGGGNNEIERA